MKLNIERVTIDSNDNSATRYFKLEEVFLNDFRNAQTSKAIINPCQVVFTRDHPSALIISFEIKWLVISITSTL
jgi:hypothetical protein